MSDKPLRTIAWCVYIGRASFCLFSPKGKLGVSVFASALLGTLIGLETMTKINIKLTAEQIQAIGKAVAAPKPAPKRKAKVKTGLTLAQYLDLIGFNPDQGMRSHLGHMLTRYAKARGLHIGKYGPANVYPVSVLRDFVKD